MTKYDYEPHEIEQVNSLVESILTCYVNKDTGKLWTETEERLAEYILYLTGVKKVVDSFNMISEIKNGR